VLPIVLAVLWFSLFAAFAILFLCLGPRDRHDDDDDPLAA